MKKALFIFSLMCLMLGCSAANKSGPERLKPPATSTLVMMTCTGHDLSARILNNTGVNFREAVGDLVSATMDPDSLGDISGEIDGDTGVDLSMVLAFTADKKINSSASQFKMTIKDSLVGQTGANGLPIPAIIISKTEKALLSGGWDEDSKILNIQFADDSGTISVKAEFMGDELTGQVSFVNSSSWDDSSPRQGELGHFKLQSCKF